MLVLVLLSCSEQTLERFWKYASMWRAGSNVPKVSAYRDSLKMCPNAVRWLFERKLGEDNYLGLRAIRDMFMNNYRRTLPYLKQALLSLDTMKVKQALYLVVEWKVKELGDVLWEILPRYDDRTNFLSKIIKGIGYSQDRSLGMYIVEYLNHEDELIRFRTVEALGNLKYYDAVPKIIMLLMDRNAFVRYEACRVLYNFGERALKELGKFVAVSGDRRFLKFAYMTLEGKCR